MVKLKKEREIYPQSLNLFITEKCNLNCQYCFVNKELDNFQLDFSSLKRAVDLFLAFPGEKKTISFNGGEPLLEYPLLKKTYLYAQKKARNQNIYLDLAVMTNGTLLSKNRCCFLEKNQAIVKISIDGNQATHDANRPFKKNPKQSSFKKIIQNLKNFRPNQIKLAASLVFTPYTIDSFLENIKFLQKKGFAYIEFYPDMYAWWSRDELIKLRQIFQKFSSYYISLFLKNKKGLIFKNSLLDSIINGDEVVGTQKMQCQKIHLAPDGNFYFCDKVFSLPKKEREKYIIGNISQGVDNQKRLILVECFRKKVLKLIRKKCTACPYQKYCFCPIGHYLYFAFQGRDIKKYFSNFCSIAKIYFDNFWTIKEKLKYNSLFVKLYQY